MAPRKTRRQLREERRRQQRRRLGAAGIAGLVVLTLIVVGAITFGVKKATSGGGHKRPLGQTTVLFSVTGSDGSAVESALLAHDSRTHEGVQLLLPSRVLTEVCGFGNQPLGQIVALPDGQRLSRVAVSDLLGGVTVDGSWVLSTAQLARLIDEVGGITVDVDTNVVQGRTVLLQKGPGQHLSGSRAVAFATYVGRGEDASANLVRLQGVLDGLLNALPSSTATVQRLVSSLGRGAASTLGASRLADVLVGLKRDDVFPATLPTVKIDAGSGQPAYRVDPAQTRTFVTSNLGASLPASARVTRKRVFVQNGVGTPGLVGSACTKLVAAGYAFAGSGNASHFGYTQSRVLVFDHSVASAELGDAIARALRLPPGDVAVSDAGQNVADALVILGKDYKP
jgi:anionic cell wall polymer biosynthesis LytR-Cps2A-Psr (LCP) family protein